MIKRRDFIVGLGSTAAWPVASHGQQNERMRPIAVLMNTRDDDPEGQADVSVLRERLAERGWIAGRSIDIVVRWAGDNVQQIEALASELTATKPDVVLPRTTPMTVAVQKETRAIPIVFVSVVEPVAQGFVQSLARSGGNITGFTNFEASVGGKWRLLLKEIDRAIERVLVIYNPQTAPYAGLFLRPMEMAAAQFGIEVIALPVDTASDIEPAMTALARSLVCGLVAIPDSFTLVHRDLIISLAARMRMPALYGNPSFTQSGGLLAYAVDPRDLMQRAADYVVRILRGERPADLPVQQPTKFKLSINMKTAMAPGFDIPATVLALADEVIE